MPASLRAWYTPADFEALAARHAERSGDFSVAAMTRLAEHLGTQAGVVSARFVFSHQGRGWIRLELSLQSTLSVTCQRCLEMVELEIAERVELALIAEESSTGLLPDDVEPVVLDGDRLSLQQLVEDEMIMAVPMVAKHPPGQCAVDADSLPEGVVADSGTAKMN